MRTKLLCCFLVITIMALAIPAAAQTEKEIVQQYMKKYQKEQSKKVGFIVFNGSYGRLDPSNDYNNFAQQQSQMITSYDGDNAEIERVYRSKEMFLGFGMMVSKKSSATFGFNYWLKMGSSKTADYNMSLNLATATDHEDFQLKSEISVLGVSAQYGRYLLQAPDQNGLLSGFTIKADAGTGYYFANWDLWDGIAGYNLNTSTEEVIGGKMSGSAIGFTAGLTGEMPIPVADLVFEVSAQYLYLNFGKMKWYNSNNDEIVTTFYDNRVELNMSGPRAQFGFKRYFSW